MLDLLLREETTSCQDMWLGTKTSTVIPHRIPLVPVNKTRGSYRDAAGKFSQFYWASEESFLPATKVRAEKMLSNQRIITTQNTNDIVVRIVNNTDFMVLSTHQITGLHLCPGAPPGLSHTIMSVRADIVTHWKVSLDCMFAIKLLNISLYKVITDYS